MKPDSRFQNQSPPFWATVRLISQVVGYTTRATSTTPSVIKVPTIEEISKALDLVGLNTEHVLGANGLANELGALISEYYVYRADVLNTIVRTKLMNAEQAKTEYDALVKELPKSECPKPMNKQKGSKKAEAFLTCIVNMLIEKHSAPMFCNYNPLELTTITSNRQPLRTLARRVDGAFPAVLNPIAVWEVKEYYYTTTFGSRVADGVYETLLDGMELKELRDSENIDVLHYLIVDAYSTWWDDGKSYLCRMIDMLHMGYVDEVLFGREVLERLPIIVPEWVAKAQSLVKAHPHVQTEWDASHAWQRRVEIARLEKQAKALAKKLAKTKRQSISEEATSTIDSIEDELLQRESDEDDVES